MLEGRWESYWFWEQSVLGRGSKKGGIEIWGVWGIGL